MVFYISMGLILVTILLEWDSHISKGLLQRGIPILVIILGVILVIILLEWDSPN